MTAPVRVLQSVPPARPTTNPYVVQLVESTGALTPVASFTWLRALFGRYDVFHVHWPENLLKADDPARRALRRVRTLALLARLRLTGTAVVRTMHNERPHEALGRVDGWLMARLDALTGTWICLNRHTRTPEHGRRVVIVHGHYRDWYAEVPRAAAVPGRLACVGLLRPYKGVEALLEAFLHWTRADASLLVAGRPTSDALRRTVQAAAEADARVELVLEHLDDAAMAQAVTGSELVVLPYRAMHNSGAALLALSLDRPVLVPRNAVTDDLADEVGERWVQRFDGDLDADVLAQALEALRVPAPAPGPDLSARDWSAVAAQHVAAYEAAVGRPAADTAPGDAR